MSAFQTNPGITLQGLREPETPFEILSKFAQLKAVSQGNQMRGMQIADMQGQQAAQAAIQRAIEAAGGAEEALPEIMKISPQIGLKFQKQIQEWKSADAEGKKKILDLRIAKSARLGQLAGGIRDQTSYQAAIQQAMQEGVIDQEDAQSIPPQYDPAVVQRFQQSALTAQQQSAEARKNQEAADKKTEADAQRKAPTAGQKEFADFYAAYRESKGLPKNAKVEMEARTAFRAMQRTPVPGVDVPLSSDVVQQRKEIATAGKTSPADKGDELLSVTEAGALGVPYGTTRKEAYGKSVQTADMRNKLFARNIVTNAIGSLEALSKKVITDKIAIVQRTKAAGRSIDAALASDPEYRTYQDARMALAGNLAVAQQGSRPSDADVKAIWLPLVPDVFKDTTESAKMKWDLIRVNSGVQAPGGAASGGTAPPSFADWKAGQKKP